MLTEYKYVLTRSDIISAVGSEFKNYRGTYGYANIEQKKCSASRNKMNSSKAVNLYYLRVILE